MAYTVAPHTIAEAAEPTSDHFSSEHIPQLRQLIEARFTKKTSERRNPRIIGHLEIVFSSLSWIFPLEINKTS